MIDPKKWTELFEHNGVRGYVNLVDSGFYGISFAGSSDIDKIIGVGVFSGKGADVLTVTRMCFYDFESKIRRKHVGS
jgi:hypothetical protein